MPSLQVRPILTVPETHPYGIYDTAANRGYMYIGTSAETPEFAVDVIVRWWEEEGRPAYPDAERVLILADSGGANGYRPRVWKERLQRKLSDEHGLEVTVCHYPPGCSKWNPVEHRLFSFISVNWAAAPLRTLETMLALIRGTRTRTGLELKAWVHEKVYETGRGVPNAVMKWIDLHRHETCPNWSYTLRPRPLPEDFGNGFTKLYPWHLAAIIS